MSGFSPDFRSGRKLSCEMTAQAAGMLVLGDALQTLGGLGTHILSVLAHCVSRVDTGLCTYWHGRSTEQLLTIAQAKKRKANTILQSRKQQKLLTAE